MKTLQDLVNRLNNINHLKPFLIEYRCDKCYLVVEYSNGMKNTVVEFSKTSYRIHEDISCLPSLEQNIIVDYLANTAPCERFLEKKYNIIIGRDSKKPIYDNQVVATYRKNVLNDFFVDDNTLNSQLSNYDYQFTESEIEELKSTLPENMAKIVDLGKVEVKDDED